MKTNIFIDILLSIPYLVKILVMGQKKCSFPIKLQDSLNCNITRKKRWMKLVFCLQINIEVFYKLIHSFWVYIARHAQSTQNYKFAISLQYLKEKVKMKLIFILQINIKVFFQIDDIILGVCVASHAQITQNCNFAFFCNIFRKKWLMKLIFCIQISIKTSYKLIL